MRVQRNLSHHYYLLGKICQFNKIKPYVRDVAYCSEFENICCFVRYFHFHEPRNAYSQQFCLKNIRLGTQKKNVEFTNLRLNFDKLIIRPLKTFVLPANLCFPCWVDVIMHFLTIILPLKMKGADMLLSVPPPFFLFFVGLKPFEWRGT